LQWRPRVMGARTTELGRAFAEWFPGLVQHVEDFCCPPAVDSDSVVLSSCSLDRVGLGTVGHRLGRTSRALGCGVGP
jgi:hypothetical protein